MDDYIYQFVSFQYVDDIDQMDRMDIHLLLLLELNLQIYQLGIIQDMSWHSEHCIHMHLLPMNDLPHLLYRVCLLDMWMGKHFQSMFVQFYFQIYQVDNFYKLHFHSFALNYHTGIFD